MSYPDDILMTNLTQYLISRIIYHRLVKQIHNMFADCLCCMCVTC